MRAAAAREGGTPFGLQPGQSNGLLRLKIRKSRLGRKPETAVPGFPGWIVRALLFRVSWAGSPTRKTRKGFVSKHFGANPFLYYRHLSLKRALTPFPPFSSGKGIRYRGNSWPQNFTNFHRRNRVPRRWGEVRWGVKNPAHSPSTVSN